MGDLVNSLRDYSLISNVTGGYPRNRPTLTGEAADRIEALEAENAMLREALKPFSDEASWWFCKNYNAGEPVVEGSGDYEGVVTVGDLFRARAALKQEGGE